MVTHTHTHTHTHRTVKVATTVSEQSCLIRQQSEVSSHDLPAAKLGGLKTADDVLQSGGHHEVLLLQTQLLAFKELDQHRHRHI